MSAEALSNAIAGPVNTEFGGLFGRGDNCPLRRPSPKPEPTPDPDPDPQPLDPAVNPDVQPDTNSGSDFGWGTMVAVVVAGLAIGSVGGLIRKLKEQYSW
jgi:hypothetical protein